MPEQEALQATVKIVKADNGATLFLELPVKHKELKAVMGVEELHARDEEGNVTFRVLESNAFSFSTTAIALPLSKQDHFVRLQTTVDTSDEMRLRYKVAKMLEGLNQVLANYQAASDRINGLIEGVVIE